MHTRSSNPRETLQSELGQNVLPPASLTVEVDAGSLTGLETVTQADPPLTDSRTLRWVMPRSAT
jgi:hypothetical protein